MALITAILNFVLSNFKNDVDFSANMNFANKFEPVPTISCMTDTKSVRSSKIDDEILIEHCNSGYILILSAETFKTDIILHKSSTKTHFIFQKD
jgi:hypothetical protein